MLLGLKISESSADRQSSREHSVWTNQRIVHSIFISWWLCNSDLLKTWLPILVNDGMRLVNVASSLLNPVELSDFTRFMIITQVKSNLSMVLRPNRSTVSNIDNENIVVVSHYQISTTSRLAVLHLLCGLEFSKAFVNVVQICAWAAFEDCLLNIVREFWLQYNVIVEMFLQVLGTLVAAMAIIDSKYLYLRPLVLGDLDFLVFRLDHVKNNSDSIFVCFSYQSNMRVGCEWLDNSELLVWGLWHLEIWQIRPSSNLKLIVFISWDVHLHFLDCLR